MSKSELELLCHYYAATRQVGHTTAMMQGAGSGRVAVIAADVAHARHLAQQGVEAYSRAQLGSVLRGLRQPVLVDHWALQCMADDALGELRARVVEADAKRKDALGAEQRLRNRVVGLHQEVVTNANSRVCGECGFGYPCQTVRIMSGGVEQFGSSLGS